RATFILLGVSWGINFGLLGAELWEKQSRRTLSDDVFKEWAVKTGLLLTSMFLAGLVIGLVFEAKEFVRDEDIIKEAADLIVKLNEQFPSLPMVADTKQIQRVLDVLPGVIQHINLKDRAKLESLARKKGEIPDDSYFQQVAEIVSKHLGQNKEDLDTLVNAYKGVITLDASRKYWSNGFEPVR
ncbi:MAG: hypothetical protein J5608_00030, partial [Alphaproteobacteria bacterium]|nr:hypothetical protein [Alphaproteobacteria bacterium]